MYDGTYGGGIGAYGGYTPMAMPIPNANDGYGNGMMPVEFDNTTRYMTPEEVERLEKMQQNPPPPALVSGPGWGSMVKDLYYSLGTDQRPEGTNLQQNAPPQGYVPGFHGEFSHISPLGQTPPDPRQFGGGFGINPFMMGLGQFIGPNFGQRYGAGYNPYMPMDPYSPMFPPISQPPMSWPGMGGWGMRGYAQGGMVNPEGGMGDGIPAMIEGAGTPTALSPGEYVVPADVVSMIGDGDTNAGADQLDAMVSRVRMSKTGSPAQMPPMDPTLLAR